MNERMLVVMRRRGELLEKIAAQREQIAEAGAHWQAPLALADQGLAVVRFLRARPALIAGLAALLVIRKRGVAGLIRAGWMAWKGYRYLSTFSGKLPPRP